MKQIAALSLITLAVAGCTMTEPAATRVVDGQTQVQILPQKNCFDHKCFTYHPGSNTVSATGRRPAAVPAGIPASSGYVTEAQFSAMFDAAWRAETIKSDRD